MNTRVSSKFTSISVARVSLTFWNKINRFPVVDEQFCHMSI